MTPKTVVLERGGLVYAIGWFFVIVNVTYSQETKKVILECICDNANNRYFWEPEECEGIWDKLTVAQWSFSGKPEHIDRDVPHDVIADILSGLEDERFNDYRSGDR